MFPQVSFTPLRTVLQTIISLHISSTYFEVSPEHLVEYGRYVFTSVPCLQSPAGDSCRLSWVTLILSALLYSVNMYHRFPDRSSWVLSLVILHPHIRSLERRNTWSSTTKSHIYIQHCAMLKIVTTFRTIHRILLQNLRWRPKEPCCTLCRQPACSLGVKIEADLSHTARQLDVDVWIRCGWWYCWDCGKAGGMVAC